MCWWNALFGFEVMVCWDVVINSIIQHSTSVMYLGSILKYLYILRDLIHHIHHYVNITYYMTSKVALQIKT